jgi:hypothetical protein
VKQLTMSRLGHHIKGHPSKARFSKSRSAARRPATEGEPQAKPGVAVHVLDNDVTELTSSPKLNSPSTASSFPSIISSNHQSAHVRTLQFYT